VVVSGLGGELVAVRVDVPLAMLTWACDRSLRAPEDLHRAVPELSAWESGDKKPTLKQLQKFAKATYTPLGYLLLTEPPADELPIPDFRTGRGSAAVRPSPNLLDTIYLCEQRQEWYRNFGERQGSGPVTLVGESSPTDEPIEVAARMRETSGFTLDNRSQYGTWTESLRGLVDLIENTGVLVMISGIVGSNTSRPLDPDEFRGFALVDDEAPLIFINGADTKAAQIFTLAHELAHVWLGQSAVDNPKLAETSGNDIERWCNEVAAEFLMPIGSISSTRPGPTLTDDIKSLARQYKISTLVVLRRLHDAGQLDREDFRVAYSNEFDRVVQLSARRSGGGNFYNTQPLRVSRRFARALITDTLEGQTLHRDAFRLLNIRKAETFYSLGAAVEVAS
jgi:Zn-dependent peptidase ImmA (M78 family)/transcriptional regulator with XRE-family HTH domain